MADQGGPPLKNDDVIPTSWDVISPFCGRQRKQFSTYYLPIKSHCHSFNALVVLKGGGNFPNQSVVKLSLESCSWCWLHVFAVFKFWLVHYIVCICCDRSEWLLWFCDTQLKTFPIAWLLVWCGVFNWHLEQDTVIQLQLQYYFLFQNVLFTVR